MRRWKTKRAFIKWMEEKRDEAKKNVNGFDVGAGIIDLNTKNSIVCIEHIENMIDDNMIDDFNYLFENINIDIHYLDVLIKHLNELNIFKKSGFSEDAQKYEKQVEALKKNADTLQNFMVEDMPLIRIPLRPQDIEYSMFEYLYSINVSEDIIDALSSFFGKERKAKMSKTYIKTRNEIEKSKNFNKFIHDKKWYKAHKND